MANETKEEKKARLQREKEAKKAAAADEKKAARKHAIEDKKAEVKMRRINAGENPDEIAREEAIKKLTAEANEVKRLYSAVLLQAQVPIHGVDSGDDGWAPYKEPQGKFVESREMVSRMHIGHRHSSECTCWC